MRSPANPFVKSASAHPTAWVSMWEPRPSPEDPFFKTANAPYGAFLIHIDVRGEDDNCHGENRDWAHLRHGWCPFRLWVILNDRRSQTVDLYPIVKFIHVLSDITLFVGAGEIGRAHV